MLNTDQNMYEFTRQNWLTEGAQIVKSLIILRH